MVHAVTFAGSMGPICHMLQMPAPLPQQSVIVTRLTHVVIIGDFVKDVRVYRNTLTCQI